MGYRPIDGRMAAALLVAASLVLAAATAAAREDVPPAAVDYATGDPAHGERVAQAACAACHGAEGTSAAPGVPKLAGQDPAYLYRQLWAFRTGARPSAAMAPVVAPLSDKDMADVASFYAGQTVHPDPAGDEALVAAGARLFYGLGGAGMMGSCAACHREPGRSATSPMGGGMMGMMGRAPMGMMGAAGVPNLNGQHAAYIVGQLDRFADGERQGGPMGRIAGALSEPDRKAVAAYLASQP